MVSESVCFLSSRSRRVFVLTDRCGYVVQVSKGELTREDANKSLGLLASKVLLGALSVAPPPVKHLDGDMDPEKEKHERMASLVGHQVSACAAALCTGDCLERLLPWLQGTTVAVVSCRRLYMLADGHTSTGILVLILVL